MSDDLQLTVELDGEKRSDYHPGETISGRARISAPSSWEAKYAELSVGWSTSGLGDTDSGSAGKMELAKKGEMVQPTVERKFSFRLPEVPLSYSGRKLKINWAVGLYVRADGGKAEQSCEVPFHLVGRRENTTAHESSSPPPPSAAAPPLPWEKQDNVASSSPFNIDVDDLPPPPE